MKVLHLISGGDTGGAKTHIISLLKGLNKVIDAKVICFIEDTFYTDAKNAGIDIEVYEQKGRSDMSVVGRLADLIADEGYDIVHCHGARANFIAMFLKGKIKKPLITTIHSDYKLDFKDNFYKRMVYTTLNKFALKIFNYYIAISDSFKEMLIERGFKDKRIYVAYNGIDLDEQLDIMDREEFLRKYNIHTDSKKLVGIAARLDSVKDHETFIKAANLLLKKRNDVLFLIAGDGNDEKKLKAMTAELNLEDGIRFLGFVKENNSFFNAIDINTLTSISESFPYAILEGARLSKPAVATKVGGLGKLIRNDENGYLIEIGDYTALADKLLLMLEDEQRTKAMGVSLYNDVKKDFSTNAMAERHVKIYEDILNNWR